MLSGANRVADTMSRLRALGVSLAIDDFGTGYSSLGYLPRLPFDALKNRSLIRERNWLAAGNRRQVHALVTLAHDLGMRVIVEGIETQKQLQLITEPGSNEIQGYLLGWPTPDPSSQLQAQERSTKSLVISVPLSSPAIATPPDKEKP